MSETNPSVERQWFHLLHGLHDDEHHQAHGGLIACVPLVFRSDYDSLFEQLQAAQERLEFLKHQHRSRGKQHDRLKEQLEAAQSDRDEAIAHLREIQRRYVRTDKA